MQIASWLLVTSTLAGPTVGPAPAAPAIQPTPSPSASFAPPVAAQQRRAVAPAVVTAPPHRLGVGGSLQVSNYGINASTRYWFSRHVGLSMAAGWYRPRQYGYTGYTTQPASSTIGATPSVMVTFGQTDPNREVSLRPYAGVGVSYLRATSRPGQVFGAPPSSVTYSSTSPVGLGGTEILFRDYPKFTLSAEGTYYRLPAQFVNRANVDGLNFQVAAHFYLK